MFGKILQILHLINILCLFFIYLFWHYYNNFASFLLPCRPAAVTTKGMEPLISRESLYSFETGYDHTNSVKRHVINYLSRGFS